MVRLPRRDHGPAAETGGAITIVQITYPPGSAAPLHVHHREDEAFSSSKAP